MENNKLITWLYQFRDTIFTHSEAVIFIRKNRLWVGFWHYGWVGKVMVALAVLLGIKLMSTFFNWWNTAELDGPGKAVMSVGTLFQNVAFESFDFLFDGGMKYIMMILLEVIIFHICGGTLKILIGKEPELTFNSFVKAQIRVIKVAFQAYILEMVISLMIKITFGIFGTYGFLEPVLKYSVHCYFLGLIVFDNYVEQFGYSIKESVRYARDYAGVCLALGLTTNIFLLIPVFGAIIAPLIAAVTVTLVMYHISDFHLISKPDSHPANIPQ